MDYAHVIAVAHDMMPIFQSPADYHRFLSMLALNLPQKGIPIHAFAAVPNHVHFLMPGQSRKPDVLWGLGQPKKTYGRWFHDTRPWTFSTAWKRTTTWVPIEDKAHLKTVIDYIHGNPVKEGLCRDPVDWPFSSAAAYDLGIKDPLVTKLDVIKPLFQADGAAHLLRTMRTAQGRPDYRQRG